MRDVANELEGLIDEGDGRFRVHTRAYADKDVFNLEMERIFRRSWIFMGHESEVADGGDYKATYIAQLPVIMARSSDDGQVRVFFNRCRHRGATVCQMEYGNSNYFRCAYHGWVYNNGGGLVGVPFEEGYGEGFDKDKLGLVQVPRVALYKGFVFASLSADGPSLEDQLGNARPYIDQFANLGGQGIEVKGGIHKHVIKCNWKLQLENTVDSYHFGSVHASIVQLFAQRGRNMDSAGRTGMMDLGGGQGLLDFAGLGYGAGGVANSAPFNLVVFPNVAMLSVQLRVVRPIDVDTTEVSLYFVRPKGATLEALNGLIHEHEYFYGPSSFGGPDDVEVAMERVQRGFAASEVEWRILDRGLATETTHEGGVIHAELGALSETSERAIYRGWRQLMSRP
ncbi:MAG TPA: Rieske 2Fe-2S domain-containing protein [Dehalococcoidia bacterium]|nr:Rieske 2Fe-2S domain-containing protein [Dehalococcoidia bacterium]